MELGLIHVGRTALYCLYMGKIIWSNSYFIDFFGFIIYQTRSKEVGSCSSDSRISRKVLVGQTVTDILFSDGITLKILSTSEFLFPISSPETCVKEDFFFT